MPQMSPMSWLSLYMIFTMIFIMFCMLNYFCFLPSYHLQQKKILHKTSMNWKW